jgi:macrolide-specific efflux system membrane fusion protein
VYLAPPDNASQKELATLIETLKSGSPEEETGTPGAPPGPPGAPAAPGPDVNPEAAGPSTSAQAGDQAAGGEFDWRAAMRQLRNLSEEERAQKTQEILQKMTPEQRQQYEQRAGRMQNMSPEDRQRMRGQRGGGGQGGRGQGGRGQRPAPRPAEQGDNTDGTG